MPLLQKGNKMLTLASVVIGFLFVVLIKVHGWSGNQSIPPESALPSLVATEQENQQLSADNDKLRQELGKYAEGQNASTLATQQLQEARMNAGLIALNGPGIRITLDDSTRQASGNDAQNYVIHEEYIRQLVNILWNGGAEAIAVNGQRITSNTEVFCSGAYIQINGTRQMPPYVIEAIGDPKNLQSALKFYFWDKLGDFQQQYGITRRLEVPDKIAIPAGKLREYHYAEPLKEGT